MYELVMDMFFNELNFNLKNAEQASRLETWCGCKFGTVESSAQRLGYGSCMVVRP